MAEAEQPPLDGHMRLAAAFADRRTLPFTLSAEELPEKINSLPECIALLDGEMELPWPLEVAIWERIQQEVARGGTPIDSLEFPHAGVTLSPAEVALYQLYQLETIPDKKALYDRLWRLLTEYGVHAHISSGGRVLHIGEVYKEIDWTKAFGKAPTREERTFYLPRILQYLCFANEFEAALDLALLILAWEDESAKTEDATAAGLDLQGLCWNVLSSAMNALQRPSIVYKGAEVTSGDCYLKYISFMGPDVNVLSAVPQTLNRPTGTELAWRLALFTAIVITANVAAKRYLCK
jgi:hypothetical protein